MAAASASASRPPALAVSQARVAASVWAQLPSAAVKAAQTSTVVLRLLGLPTVSPKPPSGFRVPTSHPVPLATRVLQVASSPRSSRPSPSRSSRARARTAVAVDRALLDNSPSQWPSRTRESSSFRVAEARAWRTCSRSRSGAEVMGYRLFASKRSQMRACADFAHLRF